MSGNDPKSVSKRRNKYSGAIGVCIAIALVVVLTGLLRARAEMSADTPTRLPLPVAVTTYTVQENYHREVSYLGLVTAGHKANLAFEIPGRIAVLNIRQGTPVKAGDILAKLDDANQAQAEMKPVPDLPTRTTDAPVAQMS